MAVQNYGQQNYNPPTVLAMPNRNYVCGDLELTSGATFTLFRFDCIVAYRGGPLTSAGVTPVGPGAGLILTISANTDVSGVTFMPQIDIGDGTMRDLIPVAQNFLAGVTTYTVKFSAFHIRGRVTRIAASTTTVIFNASILSY